MNSHTPHFTENELLEDAYSRLREEYYIPVQSLEILHSAEHGIAGIVNYQFAELPLFIHCVDKKTPLTVVQIANYRNHYQSPSQYVFLTSYINPALAERLKDAQIQFIDHCGNAYLHQDKFFIFVKGNKPKTHSIPKEKQALGKAFGKKGLQVTYVLLSNPKAITWSYRELAKTSNVSLGTIGDVMLDLNNQGYIDKDKKTLLKGKTLMQKWAKEYGYLLRKSPPTIKYTTSNIDWYSDKLLEQCNALLGGDAAADRYTHFLNSNKARVYISKENHQQFLRHGRLKRIREDEHSSVQIELVEPFTELDFFKGPLENLVNPLIVYAELLASDNVRNLEVADKLYDQYLHHY
ncbi:type IV toxin-antitoxin system AbiEi family antitoxin [Aliivibrio kagoshimensis]|uniref:type IV toxin-antitoxin system AbiEi family antitoxin n=1 Tax=Aliivibrio kagoshimensis TaxID=2910230 RepID=UPI003D0A2904